VGGATLFTTLGALATGSLTPGIAVLGLLVGLIGMAAAYRGCARLTPSPGLSPLDHLAGAAFLATAFRQFGWICFRRGEALETLLPYNYGDLPLHWTYVEYFAQGAPFWPQNPIFTGERLRYPFGVDLFTALFVSLKAPLPPVLIVMGLVASGLVLVTLLYWGRGFAVAALLFSGGLAAMSWPLGAGSPAVSLPELAWKNLFLSLFVPQRGFLFALPAGLILLGSWRERLLRGRPGLPAWVEGIIWGVLPLFHLHTFLFVSLLFGIWSLLGQAGDRGRAALLWALVPGTWSTLEVTDYFRAASLVGWQPGWMLGEENPVFFLARNFWLFLPLALWAGGRALRKRDRERLLLLGPGLGLFALLFLVRVAPWAWDNTKMMVWCYLLVLPAVGELVRDSFPPRGRVVILASLFLPGFLSVAQAWPAPSPRLEILDVPERDGVCTALAPLPMRARVATAQSFNHPVALCGHALVAGYGGHLWSHGISAEPVTTRLGTLLGGESGWEQAGRELGARYLFWGWREETAFPKSRRPWEAVRPLLARGAWGSLYDLGE
jgi:hypothetical protein